MKKILIIAIACLLLGGQTTLFAKSGPKYLDPTKAAYKKPMIGAICETCYSTFMISGYQLEHNKDGMCPYCGQKQNLKDAANRYTQSQLILREYKKPKK